MVWDSLNPFSPAMPLETTQSRVILLLFLAAFLGVIGGSLLVFPDRIKAARERNTLLAARALYTAIEAAGADRTPGGIGYPAESGAKSTPEYYAALQEKGYLLRRDYPLLSNLVLANTSEADPRATVLFLSRSGYSRYGLGREKKLSPTYLVCHLDGTIDRLPIDIPPTNLPPRSPTLLEP